MTSTNWMNRLNRTTGEREQKLILLYEPKDAATEADLGKYGINRTRFIVLRAFKKV
jgi:hypothetical protein